MICSMRSAADMEAIVYHLQLTRGHLQSPTGVESGMKKSISGANGALLLLLGINLFNYIDRQILAALEPDIRASFFAPDDVNAMTKTGLLGDAFFVTYMISAPILGLLADRFSRWIIVGSAVILWSLASGGSGRSEEHTSELQSLTNLVCRLLLEKKKKKNTNDITTNRYSRAV